MNSARSLFNLDGRTALITGGSRGLGLQIAEALGQFGARIVLTARKADELDRAQQHLRERDVDASYLVADVADPESIQSLVDASLERLEHIDILVNNAGASWGAPAEDYPLEAWDKVFNLNVRGLFLLSQQIAKRSMIPNRYGRILNIASIAGLRGNPPDTLQTIAYNAAKGAVVNLTRALAGEWGRHNITVNALAPGFFASEMTDSYPEGYLDSQMGRVLVGRPGDPRELAAALIFLVSEAGGYVTGTTIPVEGGMLTS